MPHPLATDPNVDDVLRRAFAKVTHQVVRTYDDGSQGIENVTSLAKAYANIAAGRPVGFTHSSGRTLVSVNVRAV